MIRNPQLTALTTLVQTAQHAGFTLPDDVTTAHDVWLRLSQTEIPEPRSFDAQDAADRIVQAVTNGDRFDPIDLCRDALKARDEERLHTEAAAALALAVNKAASAAVATAESAADEIVVEHLRPAYEELLTEVREVAEVLRPYTDPTTFQLDLQAIIGATSAKGRDAYLGLPRLVERHRLIRQARDRANAVGALRPQYDGQDMFASFADPMAFHPGWKHPAPVPPLPAPQDPTARLLWTASEQAAAARPWLPTVAEQDTAWWERFGQAVENRRMAGALAASRGVPMSAA